MTTAAVQTAPPEPGSTVGDLPKLSPACSFHVYDNALGREEYVLCLGERQFKISALARRILERLDGNTSLEEVAAGLQRESVEITAEQLRTLLEQRYSRLGVLEPANGQGVAAPVLPVSPAGRGPRPGFPLLLTWDLIPQRAVAWLAGPLSRLYARAAAPLLLTLIALAHVPVYARPLAVSSFAPESYLWILGLCLASVLFHEMGHAAAVSRFGGTPGRIGFGLYLLMPTFYADVSQLWRFPRRQRMVVDLGGAYFQQIAFVAFAAASLWSGRSEPLAACRMIDLMVLTALNPIFRFDGYWFLVDYLSIPKLHSLALRYPFHRLRQRAGRPVEPLALPELGRTAGWVFRSYSLLSSFFLIAILWIAFHSLSATLTQFPTVVPQALHAAVAAFEAGDVLLLLSRGFALFFLIALPATAVMGLGIYLGGLARWLAVRIAR